MKKLKVFLALLLALTMVLSMAACGGNSGKETDPQSSGSSDDVSAGADASGSGKDLSWLNLGGTYPVVAEGTEKTLSLCLPINDETVDTYKERFEYIFVVEQMNINLEVQAVPSSAWSEKLPLILADTQNLPDLIMSTGFSTGDLLRYGQQEGLLLDIAPYITEEYMPCLASLFEDHPEYKIPWTDAEGHVWGVGLIAHTDRPDEMQWHYLNYQWMKDCGLDPQTDLPTTLDEFTDLMRKFKEVKSAEFGEEIYPIAGRYTGWNSIYRYLLAACGFVGSNRTDSFPGGGINMRNGKVTLPVADREGYEGFVKTLKLWYDEGLIHPEYFTAEASAMEALISAGKVGYLTVPPFVWVGTGDMLEQWWGAPLLTSQWCEKPGVPSNAAANGSPQHVITTSCEEVELALAFYDFFFQRGTSCGNQNYFITSHGAYEGTELAEKYPQFTLARENGKYAYTHIVDSDQYVDANDMLTRCVTLWGHSTIGYSTIENEAGEPQMPYSEELLEIINKYRGTGPLAYEEVPFYKEDGVTGNRDIQGLSPLAFNWDYRVAADEEFPAVVYFDEETQETRDELYTALKEYATTETAKFVVGDRPIEELSDYFDEIDALGAQEYIKIYQDYYDAVVGG